MGGVEILSSQTIFETEVYWWLIGVGAVIGLLISIIYVADQLGKYGFDGALILFAIMITLVGAFAGLVGAVVTEHDTDTVDYIEYKVAISEDVDFMEFMDKYELLDQEGKIYTVRERSGE